MSETTTAKKSSTIKKTSRKAADPNMDFMERFAQTFETSARRWELVVYPALFAFIVLAAYGFFLIYSLTQDVAHLSRNISVMTRSVDMMSNNLQGITSRMQSVALNMNDISQQMDNLEPMRVSMENIDHSTQTMSATTHAMSYGMNHINGQMATMNRSMLPIAKIGSFFPW